MLKNMYVQIVRLLEPARNEAPKVLAVSALGLGRVPRRSAR